MKKNTMIQDTAKKTLHNVKIGKDVKIFDYVNAYGCSIGDESKVGAFVEVQKGATIGRRCKISSHSFICEGVTIEDDVFIGHNVNFINDKFPRATNSDGSVQCDKDWATLETIVKKGASIGTGSVILGGISIGKDSIVGAGSVVTRDVPDNTIVCGNPARSIRKIDTKVEVNEYSVPFFDLTRQYSDIQEVIEAKVIEVLRSQEYTGGQYHNLFCESLKKYLGVDNAVLCSSGTSALQVSMQSLGISSGDEVIVPSNTFIATAFAVSTVGAKVVFCDVNRQSLNMDWECLKDKITEKTKAVISVHMYGNTSDISDMSKKLKEKNIYLIEDCAQALGTRSNGSLVGTFGDVGCFSFYPSKNLGAVGEGGAIVTSSQEIANKCSIIVNQGSSVKNLHTSIGGNYRMQGIQAAVLGIKIKYLDKWIEKRRSVAKRYIENLKNGRIEVPIVSDENYHSFHLFPVLVDDRSRFTHFLTEKNVGYGTHYPVPCHLQDAYEHLGYCRGDLPVSEFIADHIVTLPMFPEMTDEEVTRVLEVVNEY
ncbi:aminotransferase class I/II-fold pyridoxal phosphate-dependent enzyme [Pseudobacteriovorax antillogorgiicola]|uniref:dTDP-4-amino-4,6-dideoxygalactose transaminase n=1 Tax=Pseudobacteriovorax antillogorgiicola TaxID=1513793 RepID=A0A1Y6CMM6_9BACT|nr:aminotransferase class I/II-fold pyridoxal phosphate-dependent enzyme [Pseudobacteriovorax antillogorgiicola]TCS45197.1 dTDP-4-amino-4,6-dideoxygalactose transaminase [Pseudobacteriovorax antillogorgiicola]SMF75556.1 dTDP-4-amino-4,6-dideoxygalactose transaminase [Pseudobacteriovorax antillogorgiicola]